MKGVSYMLNITKKVLEDEVKLLNNKDIKLVYQNRVYNLSNKSKVIFIGSAKETYIYLQGLKYGMGVLSMKSEKEVNDNDDLSALDYLKLKEGKNIIIEAKKIAQDGYFSQCKNKYRINIEKVTPAVLHFTAKASVIAPSGVQMGSVINIPLRVVKLKNEMTIDEIGELILKAIDMHIVVEMKDNKDWNNDKILWITKDIMWYLGWNNEHMLTKKVDFKVI